MTHHEASSRRFAVALAMISTAFLVVQDGARTEGQAQDQQPGQSPLVMERQQRGGNIATPTFVDPAPVTTPPPAPARRTALAVPAYDQQRLLAGHLLRRLGFGPNSNEMKEVLRLGMSAYIEQQLNPSSVKDKVSLPKAPKNFYDDRGWIQRWYVRMVQTRRQLQEKMTLIWHEHFATSDDKVGVGSFMHDQEEFLRLNCLGRFRDLLIGISKDQAMLIWLDNDGNDGTVTDDLGNPVPPNENYAREFLQLFTTGTAKLNLDGTPVTDTNGVPLPAYTEHDIREIARAITGWHVVYQKSKTAVFDPSRHDSGPKTIMGVTIQGRPGLDGANEIQDLVNIVMQHQSVAPFISKILIQKLATETPTPGYVQRVATIFKNTSGDIKATVRAILIDTEFTSDAVVRSQYREPIEQFVGALRALAAKTQGGNLIGWTFDAGQLIYYPPSVFSFYPPGNKGALVNTALTTIRDRVADEIVRGGSKGDTTIDVITLIRKNNLTTPDQVVDYLSDALLAAPLQPEVRNAVIAYMEGRVDNQKFRGAIWLILCSPDFQRN